MQICPFKNESTFNDKEKEVLDRVFKEKDKYIFDIDNDQISVRELNPEDIDDEANLTLEEFNTYFSYSFDMFPEEFIEKLLNYQGCHGASV